MSKKEKLCLNVYTEKYKKEILNGYCRQQPFFFDIFKKLNENPNFQLFGTFIKCNKEVLPINREEKIERMFAAYCMKVIKNRCRDYIRSRKYIYEREISLFNITASTEPFTEDVHFIAPIVFGNELIFIEHEELRDALKKLDEEEFRIIMYYYFLEMNDREIAELLKVSKTGTWEKRQRALKSLKRIIVENWYE